MNRPDMKDKAKEIISELKLPNIFSVNKCKFSKTENDWTTVISVKDRCDRPSHIDVVEALKTIGFEIVQSENPTGKALWSFMKRMGVELRVWGFGEGQITNHDGQLNCIYVADEAWNEWKKQQPQIAA